VGQVRLDADRGYDFAIRGASYRARRLRVRLRLSADYSMPALLDTGAYFSFFPQRIWASRFAQVCRENLDPEKLVWFPGDGSPPQPLWPGTAAFESVVRRGTGIGLSQQEAIRCDFALVHTRIIDAWGGDSGPLALPSLLGYTDDLPRERRPQNILLGFAGILDRATLLLDYPNATMALNF